MGCHVSTSGGSSLNACRGTQVNARFVWEWSTRGVTTAAGRLSRRFLVTHAADLPHWCHHSVDAGGGGEGEGYQLRLCALPTAVDGDQIRSFAALFTKTLSGGSSKHYRIIEIDHSYSFVLIFLFGFSVQSFCANCTQSGTTRRVKPRPQFCDPRVHPRRKIVEKRKDKDNVKISDPITLTSVRHAF